MRIKQQILFMLMGLGLIMLTACGLNHEKQIEKSLKTSIEAKEDSNQLIIQYKVTNTIDEPQKLSFTSGLQADVILYNKAGEKIAKYSDNVMSTQAISEKILNKHDSIQQEFVFTNIPNGDYIAEAFLTAKEQKAKVLMDITVTNTIKLDSTVNQLSKSILELDQNLIDIHTRFKETRSSAVLANLEPFQLFQLYMYTMAGQDFETLYYLHVPNNEINVQTYIKESMNPITVQNNDAFMRKLNDVRDFSVVKKEINHAYIEFTLPGQTDVTQFQLQQDKDLIWRAHWMPMQ